jgi:hypothetical protein
MNRAERRRQQRTEKTRTITIEENKLRQVIDKELTEVKKHERQVVTKFAIEAMLAVTMISLNDMHGFGTIRLNRLKEHIEQKFDCIKQGLANVEDHIKEAEKLGVYIRGTEKGGAV